MPEKIEESIVQDNILNEDDLLGTPFSIDYYQERGKNATLYDANGYQKEGGGHARDRQCGVTH